MSAYEQHLPNGWVTHDPATLYRQIIGDWLAAIGDKPGPAVDPMFTRAGAVGAEYFVHDGCSWCGAPLDEWSATVAGYPDDPDAPWLCDACLEVYQHDVADPDEEDEEDD